MKVRELTFAVCAALLVSGAAAAQDAKPMSAEQKAAMEAWQKFATPAEGHRPLAGMVGTWDAEVTSWMDPGQPPMKSKGTSENRMVLGGRWVESKFTSEVMVSEGTFDSAGKVMTSTSTMDDVMTGNHVFEMWGPDPSGKVVKQMQIDYRRRK